MALLLSAGSVYNQNIEQNVIKIQNQKEKIEGVIFPAAKSGKSLLTKEIDDSILIMLQLEHKGKENG